MSAVFGGSFRKLFGEERRPPLGELHANRSALAARYGFSGGASYGPS